MQPGLVFQDRLFFVSHWSFAARHFAALSLVISLRCHLSFVLIPLSFVYQSIVYSYISEIKLIKRINGSDTFRIWHSALRIPTPHSALRILHSPLRISFPRFTCILNPHTLHS